MIRLKKYTWIGPAHWSRFVRGQKGYNLKTITDNMVAQLLQDEPEYWGAKFELKKPALKKEKDS